MVKMKSLPKFEAFGLPITYFSVSFFFEPINLEIGRMG